MIRRKAKDLVFSIGRFKTHTKPKRREMSWPDFVELMQDKLDPLYGKSFAEVETCEEYVEAKSSQEYIGTAYLDNTRNINNAESRSILFLDLDDVTDSVVSRVRKNLKSLNLKFLAYTTPGDYLPELSGKQGRKGRSYRFMVPSAVPIKAENLHLYQSQLAKLVGAYDHGDVTAYQRSRFMYMPHVEAELTVYDKGEFFTSAIVKDMAWLPPQESGNTEWSHESLANAEGVAAAVVDFAYESGWEIMPTGRGWPVQCPNHMNHTGGSDDDGSTAILLPDDVHPEPRFQCMHSHCQELNRHQFLAFHMLGFPNHACPEAHGVSRTTMRDIFHDAFEETDLEEIRQEVSRAAEQGVMECTDADLMDEPSNLFNKKVPIIDGLINFQSPWYMAGESNIGKTFMLLGMMGCVSEGLPFGGQKTIKAHCFLFDAEGAESSIERKEALKEKYHSDLDWLHIVDLSAKCWDITSPKGRDKIVSYIRKTAGVEPVGMIAFDSLNQAMAFREQGRKPFDENNASDMGEVVTALKHICYETGGSAGVVHHPAKDDKKGKKTPRGSGALHGAVDYALYVEQPDENKKGQLNLYHEKARNGIKQTPRGFVLVPHKLRDELSVADKELITSLQSDLEAPDFSEDLGTLKPKPFNTNPPGETLVLIPVALPVFTTDVTIGDKAKKAPGLSQSQSKVLMAIQELTENDTPGKGFSKNKVLQAAGKGAGTVTAFDDLVKMSLIVPHPSDRNSWRLPPPINETFRQPVNGVSDDDLAD